MNEALLRQKAELTHEIRLLEKEKSTIESQLEHLNASKNAELAQYQTEIRNLTQRKTDLIEQTAKLRESVDSITYLYTKSREAIEELKKTMMNDATKEASTILIKANSFNEEVIKRNEELKEREYNNEKLTVSLREQEATYMKSFNEFIHERDEFISKKASYEKLLETMKSDMINIKEEKEVIKSEIELFEQRKTELVEQIDKESKSYNELMLSSQKFLNDLEMRDISLKQRQEVIEKKEKEIFEEERRINDKRVTLDNAVSEMRSKGASI